MHRWASEIIVVVAAFRINTISQLMTTTKSHHHPWGWVIYRDAS